MTAPWLEFKTCFFAICRLFFIMCHPGLAKRALDHEVLRWPIYPKIHQFEHLMVDWAKRFGNPRYYGLMIDEDLVGKVKSLALIYFGNQLSMT